jgi:hypothetical protein
VGVTGKSVLSLAVLLGCGIMGWTAAQVAAGHRQRHRNTALVEVRQELRRYAAEATRDLLTGAANGQNLRTILERVRKNSGGRIAWIQVRTSTGAVVAHDGLAIRPTFSAESGAELVPGSSVFAIRSTRAGEVAVGAFALRSQSRDHRPLLLASTGADAPRLILEIAGFVARISRPAQSAQKPPYLVS